MTEVIPEIQAPKIYKKHAFIKEMFVVVETNEYLDVKMQYPIMGMKYAEKQCLVRKDVYEKLLCASEFLPAGVKIRIIDAWRPFSLQKELYEVYSAQIIKDFHMETMDEKKQKRIIAEYVSEPVDNRQLPPVHTTGGAVDVTLIDSEGKELKMGTKFDSFSAEAYTSYFENGSDIQVRDNRRMLYHSMLRAGFTNLPSEWWHYDFGDRFWAYYKKQAAFYEGIFTKEEIYEEGLIKSRHKEGNPR